MGDYLWPHSETAYEPIARRLPPPRGFTLASAADGSYKQWLRHLPLKPKGTPVRSRDADVILPGRSPVLAGVLDMDVRRNQECADTVIRLRAEYLRWAGREDQIVFHLTSEGKISWPEWKKGMRPRLEGNRLVFHKTAHPDSSRASFERYLDAVFTWCGTLSLDKDGQPVPAEDIQIGDFFVHGASPGHAVLVVDLARDDAGNLKALLLQGYMPAQSAHILAPRGARNAWFDLDPEKPVDTPIWGAFEWGELRRFGE